MGEGELYKKLISIIRVRGGGGAHARKQQEEHNGNESETTRKISLTLWLARCFSINYLNLLKSLVFLITKCNYMQPLSKDFEGKAFFWVWKGYSDICCILKQWFLNFIAWYNHDICYQNTDNDPWIDSLSIFQLYSAKSCDLIWKNFSIFIQPSCVIPFRRS